MRIRFFFAIALLSSLLVAVESRAQQGWKVDTLKRNITGILSGLEFTSANAGVIVGDTILSTTDGGKSWQALGRAIGWHGLEEGFSAIHCFTDLEWVGVGNSSFRTTDAGRTWLFDSLHTLYSYGSVFWAVEFVGSTGLAAGANNSISLSLDRGASWSPVSPTTYGPFALTYFSLAPAGTSAWVVGGGNPTTQKGLITRTTNNGASWDTVLQTTNRVVTAISFANVAVGYAAADSIYKTTDGGATWKAVHSLPASVRGMSFKDAAVGTLVASLGKIYRTVDGGANWTQQISNTLMDLWAVCFIDTSQGWAVGYRDVAVHTTNGGWGKLVSVGSVPSGIPGAYSLDLNYPNPFNPSTTIRYGLPVRCHVTLSVFNTLGQRVTTLVNGEMEAGRHEAKFDGSGCAAGVYFYRIQTGNFMETKKLVLLR
jgi:photosystem II stability/assembly factor-like uncharacterized protein